MGIVDRLKNFMVIPDDEDDEEYDYDESPAPTTGPVLADYSDRQRGDNDKIVNMHVTTQLQVVLVKPEHFEEASGIADHLNEKHTVVLNLESTNKDISRRLIDFLSGVAYANRGQIKKVANSTFIITPYNVGIMGDLLDELENTGVFY